MLHHTKKIKEIYGNIQRKLYYMIPEKWDKLYLYSSVIDKSNGEQTGELYFYYIPKGILKKKPVNVYEIPNKFNLDENEYIKFVKNIYNDIKQIRNELKKATLEPMWSNLTISIENLNFKVEYNYEDLLNSYFDSYERHIIWRYEYLKIGPEQVNNKDKEILNRYFRTPKLEKRTEIYEERIYVKDVDNIVAYNTTKEELVNRYEQPKNTKVEEIIENENQTNKKVNKNQLLLSLEEIEEMKRKSGK